MLDAGVRDVRNQGVLMRGVNDSTEQLLDLCFALQDEAMITPYYFYMCDMIPFAEHWRLSLAEAQHLQHSMMGYLPGFATPRIVCDVPFVGKRWVHQVETYDTERGMSFWRKNYRTSIEGARRPRRCRATTSTTTRSTRCPRRASSGGARTTTWRPCTRPPWWAPAPVTPPPSPTSADRDGNGSPCPAAGGHGPMGPWPRESSESILSG